MTSKIQKTNLTDSPIVDYARNLDSEFKPRTNCKFCMSEHRHEGEEYYEKTKNITATFNFFKKNNESISYNAIRNHIVRHYKKHEIQLKLKEWAEDIPAFVAIKKDRKSTLEERIAILTHQMAVICSETEGSGLEERRKTADVVKKLSDAITSLEDKMEEIDQTMEPVFIIIQKLKDIVSIRIKSSESEEVKRELMTVFEQLAESVKTLQVPT